MWDQISSLRFKHGQRVWSMDPFFHGYIVGFYVPLDLSEGKWVVQSLGGTIMFATNAQLTEAKEPLPYAQSKC